MKIKVKEMWAVAKSLDPYPTEIEDCRVDIQVDNQAIIHTAWKRFSFQGPHPSHSAHFVPRH